MLLILKIPVLYLSAVVWWAIRAEPRPAAGAAVGASLELPRDCDWTRARRSRVRGPRRGPARRIAHVRTGGRA